MERTTQISETVRQLDKSKLINSAGLRYSEFRSGLTQELGTIWRDIALGWIALAVINFGVIQFATGSWLQVGLVGLIGAVLNGLVIAYLVLFLHEGAHYNLHSDPKRNDLLCNVFVSGIVGLDVQSYRPIHWDHHRYFGSEMDTEVSYRDPLNIRFIAAAMFGVRAIQVLTNRGEKLKTNQKGPSKTKLLTLAGGMFVNGTYLAVLLYFRQWVPIASWICGVVMFFPLFGALRQLLEHREDLPEDGSRRAEVVTSATNRLFGDGLISDVLGGAGFNRHLLHHWDPQIPYTRLRKLEQFLLDTEGASYIRERQTTYWLTFRRLFQ